ncbi:vacuolar protein sorting-associated protein IST1-like [Humulus lupulus]|uniref:vacuolar protein sorting-associated protein IST1-like n=1 Tax=Humulus lupulus TaxID=3486 RepID=UPI002B40C94D|nr:vacuolar protein sorting-associated protein IST1-like [Humulus lupulus]
MGRKLDALLGRNFKVSKFKTITKLAISRISILSNQHQTRLSHARSDVKELLQLNHQERALLRIERVTMEQNMLDALSMVELYCHLLLDRIKLMGKRKGEPCPEELKEAVSSLIYAASRCGEFPELHKIREALTSKYGKDFAARAVELRNNCEVNPKMVQKFSTRKPSFETRMKVLKEIASECGVTLDLEDDSVNDHKREKLNMKEQEQEQELTKASANLDDTTQKLHDTVLSEETKQAVHFSESMKTRRKYRDVADAAQEAFQSAAYAANAARAAVELSMSLSIDKGFEDRHGSDNQGGNASDFGISSTTKADMTNTYAASGESEDLDNRQSSEKIEIVETVEELGSESESESEPESESEGEDNSNLGDVAGKEKKPIERKPSSSYSDTDKRERGTCLDQHDLDSFSVPKSPMNKHYRTFNATTDDHLSHEDSIKPSSKSTP